MNRSEKILGTSEANKLSEEELDELADKVIIALWANVKNFSKQQKIIVKKHSEGQNLKKQLENVFDSMEDEMDNYFNAFLGKYK